MAIRIKFDSTHNAQSPTCVLATRSGRKLGKLPAYNIVFKDSLNSFSEIMFKVNMVDCVSNNSTNNFWDKIRDFKLMYCREYNMWFELYVELDESNNLVKNISAKSLGEVELSQINLYGIEINTETDISRDDYKVTVLFNESDPKASLLNRITEKAPHYKITHVDHSVANIQRTFSFDSITIYDAFQEIAQEINCLFIVKVSNDSDGNMCREIEVYDLESYCLECGRRGEFSDTCPECGSNNISTGYGKDTTIFVSTENLATNIQYSTNVESVKNCFKLVAGDDLMTATLVNCNPNGSGYIWYVSDEIREDMSDDLAKRLGEYDEQYEYYQKVHSIAIPSNLLSKYNELVEKYGEYSDTLESIPESIIGYPKLMNSYYNTVDMNLFLRNELMPNASMQDTTATAEASKLNAANLSPVAVPDLDKVSSSTANSAVLAMAKVVVDSRYQVKINDSSFDGAKWYGNFTVTNYSNEEDTAVSDKVTVVINDEYEGYVKQKLEKSLNNTSDESTDVVAIFNLDEAEFIQQIKKYCLSRLESFYDACQACLDILIEMGIADRSTWKNENPDLYNTIYVPYYNKLSYLSDEIKTREDEISIVVGSYDGSGELVSNGVQTVLEEERNVIHDGLNFEKFLGDDLWLEFIAYRREDTYQNDNYISDGLNNAELFEKALDFIEVAKKDIYKSAILQHSISASLKNLLAMKEFAAIVDHFEVGNWIRIRVNGDVYKLRIIEYEIDYDNLDNILIVFSDVQRSENGVSDSESIIKQATSMATSYNNIQRQAKQGEKSQATLKNWSKNGLDVTNTKIVGGADNQTQTWNSHGMLFKKYDSISDTYDDIQLKIINSTISITDDNWQTVKTAIGAYYYFHPETGKLTRAYGINGEVLIGKLLLGEQFGIYNESGNLSFNNDGLSVISNGNSFKVNPNSEKILVISNATEDVLFVDKNGKLHIKGDGAGLDISSNSDVVNMRSQINQSAEAIALCVTNDEMKTAITAAIDEIRLEINTGEPTSLTNPSVVINNEGISLTGGNINVQSGVSFLVESGGTVRISAGSGEGSFINLGEAFSASSEGITATNGIFESLFVSGKKVLTEDNCGSKIIVSATEPNENGVIWICPSSVSKVEYQSYTSSSRDSTVGLYNNTLHFVLSHKSSDILPNGQYKYTIKFPVYLVHDGSYESNIKLNIVATKSTNQDQKVIFPEYTIASISAWSQKNIEITVESTVNLCSDIGDINVDITSSNIKTYNLYIQKESYIDIVSESIGASDGTQMCSVFFKS